MKQMIPTPINPDSVRAAVEEQLQQLLAKGVPKNGITIKIDPQSAELPKKRKRILYTPQAWMKQSTIVMNMTSEIAASECVRKLDDDTYLIYDVLVYPQVVSGVTADTDDEHYDLWFLSLPKEQRESIRGLFHSHVNMGVTESGIDKALMDSFVPNIVDYFIFSIGNKRNEINHMLYDKAENLIYETKDIDYDILFKTVPGQPSVSATQWMAAGKALCRAKVSTYAAGAYVTESYYDPNKHKLVEPYTTQGTFKGQRSLLDEPASTWQEQEDDRALAALYEEQARARREFYQPVKGVDSFKQPKPPKAPKLLKGGK